MKNPCRVRWKKTTLKKQKTRGLYSYLNFINHFNLKFLRLLFPMFRCGSVCGPSSRIHTLLRPRSSSITSPGFSSQSPLWPISSKRWAAATNPASQGSAKGFLRPFYANYPIDTRGTNYMVGEESDRHIFTLVMNPHYIIYGTKLLLSAIQKIWS